MWWFTYIVKGWLHICSQANISSPHTVIFFICVMGTSGAYFQWNPGAQYSSIKLWSSFYIMQWCTLWPTSPQFTHPSSPWRPPFCFYKFHFFFFKSPYISEMIQYLSFPIWLVSLSITSSSFIQTVANGRISFILIAE